MQALKYLSGYGPELQAKVRPLLEQGLVLKNLQRRYGPPHEIRTDTALYDHVTALKNRFMRNAGPITKVAYDPKLQPVHQALGTHARFSRAQGSRLKAKREIRIASVFQTAPAPFLTMIVVDELAHLRHAAHDKSFYALCTHMEPDYHSLEFDLRLWLCGLEFVAASTAPALPAAGKHLPCD